MTRVLVLRAEEDAARTGEKLRALGFAPLVSPVLEVVATGAAAPPGDFDAALASSAKGVALCSFSLGLPLHAVGCRTAAQAAARGWRPGLVTDAAADLATEICARYAEPLRLLYLAGRDRKNDLETGLRKAGHAVVAVETYEARAAATLTQEAREAIAKGDIAAALHYSRRSAKIFARLASAADLIENLRRIPHLAFAQDAAEALRRDLVIEPWVAEVANEQSLLALLASRFPLFGNGA